MNVKATTVGGTCYWCPDQPVLTKEGKVKPIFTEKFIHDTHISHRRCQLEGVLRLPFA